MFPPPLVCPSLANSPTPSHFSFPPSDSLPPFLHSWFDIIVCACVCASPGWFCSPAPVHITFGDWIWAPSCMAAPSAMRRGCCLFGIFSKNGRRSKGCLCVCVAVRVCTCPPVPAVDKVSQQAA